MPKLRAKLSKPRFMKLAREDLRYDLIIRTAGRRARDVIVLLAGRRYDAAYAMMELGRTGK